jgi:hypothetical protein
MKNVFIVFLWLCGLSAFGQFADDAVMIPKRGLFFNLNVGQNTSNAYWENDVLYQNPLLGKITKQSASLFVNIGLSNRINVFGNLPYNRNQTSSETFRKQEGLNDLSGGVKLSVLNPENKFSIVLTGTGTKPISSYNSDLQVMALGSGSPTIAGKLILRFKTESGLYLSGQSGYLSREIIKINKEVYQLNNELVYSNEVAPPDAYDYGLKLGFLSEKFQIEAFGDKFNSLTGDNISYNQLPFHTNKVLNTKAGVHARFQANQLGFLARVSQVFSGLNTTKDLSVSAGIIFQINGRSDRFEY